MFLYYKQVIVLLPLCLLYGDDKARTLGVAELAPVMPFSGLSSCPRGEGKPYFSQVYSLTTLLFLFCFFRPLRSYAPMPENRGLYAAATVISSPSTEELSQDQGDRASLDAADSGRGSWTSCSSGSHDNIQTIQHQRSWETLPFGHTHFDYSGDPASAWASSSHMDQIMFSDHSTKYNRQNQSRESLDQAQSRASWASSTGYWGEDSEGDTGTIKRRGGKDVSIEAESSSLPPVTTEETKPVPMPAHIAVTPTAAKGLIGKLAGGRLMSGLWRSSHSFQK